MGPFDVGSSGWADAHQAFVGPLATDFTVGRADEAMKRMSREEQIAFAVAEVERVRRHGIDSS